MENCLSNSLPACHGVLSKDALDFIVLSIEEPRLTNQVFYRLGDHSVENCLSNSLPACHGVLSKDALDFIVLSIEEPRLTNQVSTG